MLKLMLCRLMDVGDRGEGLRCGPEPEVRLRVGVLVMNLKGLGF